MSIFKFAIAGAALGYGIYYITKTREDGTSLLDELIEKAPGLFEKGKKYATETIDHVTGKAPEWFEKGKQYATQTIDDVANNIRPNKADS